MMILWVEPDTEPSRHIINDQILRYTIQISKVTMIKERMWRKKCS